MNILQKSDTRISLYAVGVVIAIFIVSDILTGNRGEKMPLHFLMLISAYGIFRAAKGVYRKNLSAWWGLVLNIMLLGYLQFIYEWVH